MRAAVVPAALAALRQTTRLSPSTFTSFGRDDDPRMCRLYTDSFDDASVVLIGFPYDIGCIRNGGRPGASEGPKAFRRFAPVLGPVVNPEHHVSLVGAVQVYDAGDAVAGDGELETAHSLLEASVLAVLQSGKIPFVVGGGNDQSAPNGRAALTYVKEHHSTQQSTQLIAPKKTTLGVINIDAHLDVRPKIDGKVHSGTPFRELLEDERFAGNRFVEFACQGQQCSQAHADFVTSHGGALRWLTKISSTAPFVNDSSEECVVERPDVNPSVNRVAWFAHDVQRISQEAVFVSFDIDAVQGSDCPGVSCPGTVGLTAQEALEMCRIAGKAPNVLLMDLSELNPVVEDYRSPRLAVMMFYYFLMGVAERRGGNSAEGVTKRT